MVQQINAWIEKGSPYQEGVQLYDQYGSDSFLKSLFKRQENSFNKSKLSRLLQELLEQAPPEPPPIPARQTIQFANGASLDLTAAPGDLHGRTFDVPLAYSELPAAATAPELLTISKKIEQNYAEIRGLHPYLKITEPGEQLRQIAERIVRLGKLNAELWERKNHLLEDPDNAQLQEPEPKKSVLIDLNLLNRRELIRKSLNKAKNRLKKQGKPNPKTRRTMEAREQELREIDQEIARIKQKGGADA